MNSRTVCVGVVRALISVLCWSVLLKAVALGPLYAHGDLHDQIDDASARLSRNPDDAALLLKRAEMYRLHEEWENALKDLDRASQIDPKNDHVDLLRGKALFGAGRWQAARAALDRFLSRRPNHVDGLLSRAQVLERLEDNVSAAGDYSRAIAASVRPEPDYFLKRANALRNATPPLMNEALAGLDEGIQSLGPIITLQLAAIDLETARQNYDAALRRLDAASKAASRQESWLVKRAEILTKAGRTAEAEQAAAQALSAIESLPPRFRGTGATRQLEARARSMRATETSPAHYE